VLRQPELPRFQGVLIVGPQSVGAMQSDGLFGTGADTQAAAAAGVCVGCVGDLHAVHAQFDFIQQRQGSVIGCVNFSQLKDILRAYPDTISFALTSSEVNDGRVYPRFAVAVGA
jgi:hypothetical protein